MSCPDAFELMVFADGELGKEDERRVATHVAACLDCREQIDAAHQESQALSMAVADFVESQARPSTRTTVAAIAAALLTIPTGTFVLDRTVGRVLASGHGAFESLASSLPSEVVFRSFFFLHDHGATMLTQWMIMSLVLTLFLAVALAVWRRGRVLQPFGLTVALLLLTTVPARAASLFADDEGGLYRVPKGELVDKPLVASGQTVEIDGQVAGDALAFAQKIVVRGKIDGNLVAFAQIIEIDGPISGAAVLFCQRATVRGPVAKNLYVFSETVILDSSASVGRDARLYVERATLEGRVTRDLELEARRAAIRGAVGRDLRGQAAEVDLEASASIGRDVRLEVPSEDAVHIAEGASIAGETSISEKPPKATREEGSRLADPGFYMWKLAMLIGGLIVGLLLFRLRPSLFRRPPAEAGPVAKQLGIGFLTLVVVPVAALVALVTIIGLPLAGIAVLLWVVALYLAGIITAGVVGRLIIRSSGETMGAAATALGVGLLVLAVATEIPFIGGWIGFFSLLFGLGVITLDVMQLIRSKESSAP